MPHVSISPEWQARLGSQRDWIWRGWQIRYCFLRPRRTPAGPPLIFIHGFGAALEHWRHNLAVFADRHPVYAMDLLGFGASRKAFTTYNTQLWVEQLHDFWQAFLGEPAILVGNSLGSLVSLTAAAQYPGMAAGLAMANIPDVPDRAEMMPKAIQPFVFGLEALVANPVLLAILFRIVRRPGLLEFILRRSVYPRQDHVDADLVQMVSAPPRDRDALAAFVALSASSREPGYSPAVKELLPKLGVPILLMWGTKDTLIPFKTAERLIPLNPQITFVPFAGLGHCPQDEAPEIFNPALQNWLKMFLASRGEKFGGSKPGESGWDIPSY